MTRNRKKRKVTSTASPPLPTTIASLPDDVVADILLRLPSAAAILRAAFASQHWIRIASCSTFLRRLRGIHDYPLLLGHFVCSYGLGSTPPPHLYPALRSEADDLLAAMVRRGDFFLTRIRVQGRPGQHVLEDCRGGLLLFSADAGTLRVFDPMTHRVSSVDQPPSSGVRFPPDHRGRALGLLPNGDDGDTFRVISLRHGNFDKPRRLEVYNSSTRAWRVLTGVGNIPARSRMAQIYRGQYSPAMHAGDSIYWKYATANLLLSLDTKMMRLSDVLLPPGVTHRSAYAVGEKEDGTCCLVHVFEDDEFFSRRMQVWRFKLGDDHDSNVAQMWELEQEVPLTVGCGDSVGQVRAIVGGIVLLYFNNPSPYKRHIAFRLKSLEVEADFSCRGLARPFVIE